MLPFATTDGRCALSRSEISQYRLIHNSRNHPKVPETRMSAGCRLWSSMSGYDYGALIIRSTTAQDCGALII
jgi:hypothetical protein